MEVLPPRGGPPGLVSAFAHVTVCRERYGFVHLGQEFCCGWDKMGMDAFCWLLLQQKTLDQMQRAIKEIL